jgi:two-component system, OmpR family, alkaline phosphatase synthesis response regulator PhoP
MAKQKILIIDDEKDLLMLLEERLSSVGYDVLTADNGEDGIRLAEEKKPDMIILDILMPGISGTDVAEALKADPRSKNIPIIFLTCLYTKEDETARGHDI